MALCLHFTLLSLCLPGALSVLLSICQQCLQAVVMNVITLLDFMQVGFDPGFENLVALFLILPINPYFKIFKKKTEVLLT